MISKPGLYDGIDETSYHADCVEPAPSLSSSIAKLLVESSPMHAFYEHPRLNKAKSLEAREATKAMDMGSAIHKLVLGAGSAIKEIVADNFKTKAAQTARDEARAAGLVPLLSADVQHAATVAAAVHAQLADTDLAGIFDNGAPEVTGVWQDDGGIWCRQRIDWLPAASREGGHIIAVDLKTTGTSAHPNQWSRHAYDMGYDIQEAFYRRGLMRLIPGVKSIRFPFLVIETDEPFGVSINEFSGQALAEAEELTELAVKMWGACLSSDKWPGYSTETAFIDPPKWRSDRTEIRRLAMLHRLERWQRPLATA